jgi:hypothetical protein
MVRRTAILCLLFAGSVAPGETPPIPKAIAIPDGYAVIASFEAKGDQLYKAEKQGGKLGWVLEAPKAVLYDAKGKKAGTHYAGPTWESADGSTLVRDKTMDLKSAPAGDPKAGIPSLRLEVKAAKGKAGLLSKVVYVHRLNTRGGVAPKEAPKSEDAKIAVPYTATYVFYAKKD